MIRFKALWRWPRDLPTWKDRQKLLIPLAPEKMRLFSIVILKTILNDL